jgi:sterol desaturase/sphingolipid hydroxylase (fatty acid hydroxylase superfamily)
VATLVYLSIPWFFATMFFEAALFRRRDKATQSLLGYEKNDTRASLIMGTGNVIVSAGARFGTLALYLWLYSHRLFEIGTGPLAWVLLFFAEDFTYYWWHRASHEVRFMWAAHVNHHSSERFNLSTALRQSWTTPFTLPLFYFWLPLAGFHPLMLLTQISVSLLYQYWVHTELIGRLGPLEWIFNTPSHHRVHHGTNLEYLDRNHAGVLIVWDRLFGTFEPERARVVYGLTKNIHTFKPVQIAFHEWIALARDVRRAGTLSKKAAYMFAPPGFSPDGSTLTAKQMRRQNDLGSHPASGPARFG